MSNRLLFILILLGCLLTSSILWFGVIDQDFFYYYNVGKIVTQNQNIFTSVIDNKGPVFYIFYSIFYQIFKQNYSVGLILITTIIDTFSLFIIFKILLRDWGFNWFKGLAKNLIFIIFCLLLFKSFSIGTFMGGFYSENLGMLFLLLSIWFLGKKDSFVSGFFFSLSVLTRLTYLFFIIYLLAEIYFKFKNPKQFIGFILGGIIPLGIFSAWFYITKEFKEFINNVFILNLNYAKTSLDSFMRAVFFRIAVETRIFFILLISSIYLIEKLISDDKKSKKIIITALFISSILAVFVGRTFFYHYFLHFSFFVIISIASLIKIRKYKLISIPLLIILAYFIFFNYFAYLILSKNKVDHLSFTPPKVSEISEKKYLITIPYYPIYNSKFDRNSPDKHSSYFFLSSKYKKSQTEIVKHKKIDKTKLSNTLFLFVKRNEGDEILINEYKRNFEKEFNLVKVNEYTDSASIIEVYESKPSH